MFRILAPAALLSLAACTTEEVPLEPQISLETMQDVTRTLSSDAFEGREPGTQGGERTVEYLIEQFQAAGLQPGNGDSWVQDVPLVEVTGSNFAPLTIGDIELEHGSEWVGVSYPLVERTELTDSEVVFVGYGINAPERGWNDYEGLDMEGKTALILVNDPDYMEEGLDGTFGGRAMTYYGRWRYKYEEAARQGAAAAIVIHEDFAASYGWNVVEGGWTGAQAYADTGDGGAGNTDMNGWMTQDAARRVLAAEGLNLDELVEAASQPGFEAIPLGQTASTSFDNSIRRFTSQNVIGVLPGNQRPTEYILHTAHWDHLGICGEEGDEDMICNGAVDNATGTAALVALAEAHVAAGPTQRTQVFLAVTAEESGLLGSEYYGANPVYPLDRTVGGVNIDALYVLGEASDVTVIGGGKSELDAYLADALEAQGRSQTADAAPQAGRYYRSDHFSLAKRGVPMFYVKSGQTLSEGGAEAGEAAYQDYNTNHYHAASDEYSEDWDWAGVMQDLELYFMLARALGDTGEWPNWNEGDEFRATRDESCALRDDGC
ncbi:M28 family peptidase [Aurantiacibacter sediminis]|uniref:M28 family peptidase n=1 Tax=Aurantiacibacter sediminis TaxID=2793064 RepID=A0ABS0MZY6_9SPHN|nr:M28 family peptidase [Aurantiacibacter sediminis]MBH5321279.1 M28 family peptidase [Aurantiacibacter sediminis]